MDETVIVITGAEPLHPSAVAALPPNAIVIAADGALDHALAAGLIPAGLVGDLDSISAAGLAWAEQHATIQRHDPDKDQTDTELALAMAADFNPARLILVSGGGDRLDHTFAAIGALGQPVVDQHPDRRRVVGRPANSGAARAGPSGVRRGAGRDDLAARTARSRQGGDGDRCRWPLDRRPSAAGRRSRGQQHRHRRTDRDHRVRGDRHDLHLRP